MTRRTLLMFSCVGSGFALAWNVGIDMGFFGYLGASSTAWSYDPSSGDIVTSTESIAGGLPRIVDAGLVELELDLKRDHAGI
jgi:hypothetical protein